MKYVKTQYWYEPIGEVSNIMAGGEPLTTVYIPEWPRRIRIWVVRSPNP